MRKDGPLKFNYGRDNLLAKVRVEARGKALRWEELDEDLLVEGIVAGPFPTDA